MEFSLSPFVLIWLIFAAIAVLGLALGMHDKMDDGESIASVNKFVLLCWSALLFVELASAGYLLLMLSHIEQFELGVMLLLMAFAAYFLWVARPSTWPVASDETNWPRP